MSLELSVQDQEMLDGKCGDGVRMAMRIIVRMAEVVGAERLLDITAAHIDSTIYTGEATLEFAERLAETGARVRVPTTLNVSGLDELNWQRWSVPPDWAENSRRQMDAYRRMGCLATWTCAPYQEDQRLPTFGQQVAWGESNAIAYANSVLGARTERYPDLLDICAALTGRVPAVGLHLDENRAGQVLFRLQGISDELQQSDGFYPVLGNLLGKVAGERIPVVSGLTLQPSQDQLKGLGAAAASAGKVALFHLVGITPEAPTLEAALHSKQPEQVIDVGPDTLQATYRELSTANDDCLDTVLLGCPHFSLTEFRRLARLVAGNRIHPQVRMIITTSRTMAGLAQQSGYLELIRDFGADLVTDTCSLASPFLPSESQILLTNSAKTTYYAPGLLGRQVHFASLEDCVASAVAGKLIRSEALWDD